MTRNHIVARSVSPRVERSMISIVIITTYKFQYYTHTRTRV